VSSFGWLQSERGKRDGESESKEENIGRESIEKKVSVVHCQTQPLWDWCQVCYLVVVGEKLSGVERDHDHIEIIERLSCSERSLRREKDRKLMRRWRVK